MTSTKAVRATGGIWFSENLVPLLIDSCTYTASLIV